MSVCLLVIGCDKKIPIKPEYSVNEDATADKINLKIYEVIYDETNKKLNIKLNITNKTGSTITIDSDKSFKLYDINKVQVPNTYTNNSNIIKNNQTVPYILEYNITKKEIYELYFYSGVVENHIKFNITSKDITSQIE